MQDGDENIVDDQGTGQDAAREMLREFCKNGFEDDLKAIALVLGRPESELQQILDGDLQFDDDLAMKMKGIAQQRGIDINNPSQASGDENPDSARASSSG